MEDTDDFKDNPNWTVIDDPEEARRVVIDEEYGDEEPIPLELTPATLYITVIDRETGSTRIFFKRDIHESLQRYLGGVFFHSTMQISTALPDSGLDARGESVFTYKVYGTEPGSADAMGTELLAGGFSER